jgi:hypothetical protein
MQSGCIHLSGSDAWLFGLSDAGMGLITTHQRRPSMGMRAWMGSIAAAVMMAGAGIAGAQDHGHGDGGHSDIEIKAVSGALVVDPLGEAATATDGLRVFEGEFLPDDFWATDDPGFAADPGDLPALTNISVRGLGSLLFWGGAGWSSAPSGESLIVSRDLPGPNPLDFSIAFSSSGLSCSNAACEGVVGRSASDGSFHAHIDFALFPGTASEPSAGAYAIKLQLIGPALLDSDPFYIAFNNGMEHGAFDAAITALPVPEPETYALFGVGLVLVGLTLRRRSRNHNPT